MKPMRDYQLECLDVIHNTFHKQQAQLVQLPTGSGKTRIFLEYIKKHCKQALIIVPTTDLVRQVSRNAGDILGKDVVWNSSGHGTRRLSQQRYLIVTSAFLRRSGRQVLLDSFKFDLIVIDEAHHAQCATYLKFIQDYDCYQGEWKLLGVTATPERADKKPLLKLFHSLSYDKSIIDMIRDGYLCDLRAYRYHTKFKIDAKNVQRGDYTQVALRKLDNPTRNALVLKVYQDKCAGRKTLIFCLNVAHALSLCKLLRENGFTAECVYGAMKGNERSKILDRFRSGDVEVVTNCQLLTEGFDEPSISSIIIARPTRSKSLYCQMIGRGTRLYPGKDICEIHEVTDNAFKLCCFDVACGREPEDCLGYSDGVSLLERHSQLENISADILDIQSVKFDLFQTNDTLSELPILPHQIEFLKEAGWPESVPLTYLEAAFIIWETRKLKLYGIHNQARYEISSTY